MTTDAAMGQGALLHRANSLLAAGHLQEALAAFDLALASQPGDAAGWNSRGVVLRHLGRFDEAVASFTRAVSLSPGYAGAFFNRAVVTGLEQFNPLVAVWDLERVVALDPGFPFALGLLLHLKMLICDWQGFEALQAQVDAAVRSGRRVIEPFAYQALSQSPADLRTCAETYVRDQFPAIAPPPATPRRPGGKIRLGYLSGEFHAQATAYLMAGVYEAHDRARFELVAFDNGPDDASPMRRRLEAAFGRMVDIKGLPDADAAARIRAEGIDILVNLNGHFGNHRMGVFVRRAAPLQVNYLGFPGTLGAPCMDYLIADAVVIPPGEDEHYAERIVRLPGSYQANDDRRAIAAQASSRADCGLPAEGFVFCSFNGSYKFVPDMMALWLRLLGQVDGSVLWLLATNPQAMTNLRRAAQAVGIAPERLVFAPHLPLDQHLAGLKLADLFLDSLPYNAHTTGSDALWAGVPLLTCRGTAFSGRVGASLLQAMNLPELITENPAAYEALALALARDPARLRGMREKLEAGRTTAPLFDTARFTRHLENAFAAMWERHQRGEAPAAFDVP